MDIELLEIRDFLAANHPFDQLTENILKELPGKIQIRYFRRESPIPEEGGLGRHLFVIRSGAVELYGSDNQLLARLGEGDIFGYRASRNGEESSLRACALEDSLIYLLPAKDIDRLCEKYEQFAFFFDIQSNRQRLGENRALLAAGENSSQVSMMTTPIGELISREPVTLPPETSIQHTAQVMREHRVSSILIGNGGRLAGIVTDRDLRNRVVAENRDVNLPIGQIMTKNPSTIQVGDYAFEALLHMARHNIHHLPVMDGSRIAGMITDTDLTKRHTASAVYLVSDIYKQSEIDNLKEICSKVPNLLQNLASADATADSIGHVITAVTDALTSRLIQLAEQQLGEAPVPYAWIAAGSQAREEQTAKSDQDNCLILSDDYDAQAHGEYFRSLARFVCDGLNACGYVYCPGEMMAVTDQWRQPLKQWKSYFNKWIHQPEPKALMLTCVFFDMRCVHGASDLFDELRSYVLDSTRGNSIFLAMMAGNALTHQPPLGFFRNFVLIHGGEHDNTFDMKHTGIVPIVDLARVYALAAGSEAVNTMDRLEVVAKGGEVSESSAHDLRDALEFISELRIQHQARQIARGETPDNYMSPDDLSHLERDHLKHAFAVVRTLQNILQQRYQR